MDRDLVVSGLKHLLSNQVVDEDELQSLKDYINSGVFLVDMDDSCKNDIYNSTVDNINSIFNDVIIRTVKRTFKIRYGE